MQLAVGPQAFLGLMLAHSCVGPGLGSVVGEAMFWGSLWYQEGLHLLQPAGRWVCIPV